MDKISDFFKELKERLTSPLLSAFIFAWMIFNWKVIIVILFYKQSELRLDGYLSYLDFIKKNIETKYVLTLPAISAVLYTFVYPFIRNAILAFNSWIKSWGTAWSISVAKGGKVSVEKYIKLREIYKKRTDLLDNVLDKEGKIIKEYEETKDKLHKEIEEKNVTRMELQQWKSSNDFSQLDGNWEIHYKQQGQIFRVHILSGQISYIDNPPPNKNGKTEIRSFYRAPNGNHISMTTAFQSTRITFHYFNLATLDNMKILRGIEDDRIEVEFRRV